MTGKVFSFPQKTSSAHVRLTPLVSKVLFSASVCLRFYTDLDNVEFALFSMDTPTHSNSFTLFRLTNSYYRLLVSGQWVDFYHLPTEWNKWNSICATWDAATGMSQITINGVGSVRKGLQVGGSIVGTPIIVLGQDQDSYGGGFDANQAFIGQIRDVHMWDYAVSACEIKNYMQDFVHFTPGNYLDWTRMYFSVHGYVLVEDYETC